MNRWILETKDPNHLINRKNSFGQTPLYLAAKNGNLEVIELLMAKQVNSHIISTVRLVAYLNKLLGELESKN
jgi:ankyrin repeat protein